MFISDEYNFILMLPQKCASETMQMRLSPFRSAVSFDQKAVYSEELKRFVSKHLSYENVMKLSLFQERMHYKKLCFVRNPYDRVFSWFRWKQRLSVSDLPEYDDPEVGRSRNLRVVRRNAEKLKRAHNDFNEYLAQNMKDFKPAHKFTHYKGRCVVDFIGYQEKFEAYYLRLIEFLDLPKTSMDEAHVYSNKRVGKEPEEMGPEDFQYISEYTRASVKRINKRFKLDFKYYGYPMLDPRDFPEALPEKQ